MQINQELFFFYHNENSKTSIQSLEQVDGCQLVDLNDCALPSTLDNWASEIPELGAVLSEYTGHMSVKPSAGLVGLFNYSLFDKFSLRWALRNNAKRVFLPKVTKSGLVAKSFNTYCLSYIEATRAKNLWKYYEDVNISPDVLGFLKSRYFLPDDALVPLKGSYLLDGTIFTEYQDWLQREIPVLLDALKEVEGGPVSKFSENRLGDEARTQVQQARHIIGGGCERICGWYLANRYINRPMVRIGDSFRQRPKTLEEAAAKAADSNGNVILVFCNSAYRPVLENWICSAEGLDELPLVICALDAELASDMAASGFNTCHIPWSGNLSELWRLRLDSVRRVLLAGFNVIHSDADAVWLSNPIPLMDEIDADVIASQGTVWPPAALAAWGHVLCFGFICFRASDASVILIDQLAEMAEQSGNKFDDQKALNEILVDVGLEWASAEKGYNLKLNEKSFVCHKQTIFGNGQFEDNTSIRVAVLPHRQFRRLPNETEGFSELIVGHPYADKTAGDTERVLRSENLWVLPDTARSVSQ